VVCNDSMRSNKDDRNLVSRVIAGDTDAIEAFASRYRGQFERIAQSKGVPYPEYQDVAQEALVDALRQLSKFEWQGSLGSWLERIVRGHTVNWLRKLPPPTTELDAMPPSSDKRRGEIGEIDQLTLYPNQEEVIRVHDTLAVMSPKHRMLIILNVVGGFTAREIADRLGLPQGTVGRNITEAKEIFRRKFIGGENPDGV
jgi:RNA polymerase sigma-70 factor, ECF subfamily